MAKVMPSAGEQLPFDQWAGRSCRLHPVDYIIAVILHDFWCQVAIAAFLRSNSTFEERLAVLRRTPHAD